MQQNARPSERTRRASGARGGRSRDCVGLRIPSASIAMGSSQRPWIPVAGNSPRHPLRARRAAPEALPTRANCRNLVIGIENGGWRGNVTIMPGQSGYLRVRAVSRAKENPPSIAHLGNLNRSATLGMLAGAYWARVISQRSAGTVRRTIRGRNIVWTSLVLRPHESSRHRVNDGS